MEIIIDLLSSFVRFIASYTILIIFDPFFFSIVATLHFWQLQFSNLLQFIVQIIVI